MVANAEVAVSGKDALDCRTPSSLLHGQRESGDVSLIPQSPGVAPAEPP